MPSLASLVDPAAAQALTSLLARLPEPEPIATPIVPVLPPSDKAAKKAAKKQAKKEAKKEAKKQTPVVTQPVATHVVTQPVTYHPPRPLARGVARADLGATLTLANLTDAQVGAALRRAAQRDAAQRAIAAQPVVTAQRAAEANRDGDLLANERAQRKVLPGFASHGVDVPDLDLSTVPGTTIASDRVRSPYNVLRSRLGLEVLDTEHTTYYRLAREHVSLGEQADGVGSTTNSTIDSTIDDQRLKQVAALVLELGLTKAQAEVAMDQIEARR